MATGQTRWGLEKTQCCPAPRLEPSGGSETLRWPGARRSSRFARVALVCRGEGTPGACPGVARARGVGSLTVSPEGWAPRGSPT